MDALHGIAIRKVRVKNFRSLEQVEELAKTTWTIS